MNPASPMRRLNPRRLAHYEKENYVAYYRRQWFKLLRVSIGMVKEAFGLSLWQAIYGAYLVARAEIAFAPFPNNDVPKTMAYIRRFYAFLKRVHREDFDVEEAAQLEVAWWEAHRRLFAERENRDLVEALANLYSAAYGVDVSSVWDAAYHRAQGMLYSDLWVRDGMKPDSPLLLREENELFEGYVALRRAINPPTESQPMAEASRRAQRSSI